MSDIFSLHPLHLLICCVALVRHCPIFGGAALVLVTAPDGVQCVGVLDVV